MNRTISTDRRVRRTRQALQAALLALMKEKDYAAITVEEITARANLGRTTFYLHYPDKAALLLENFADLIFEVTHQIGRVSIAEWKQRQKVPQPALRLIFQHVADNQDFYRLILAGEGLPQATDRLRNIFVEAVNELARSKGEVQQLIQDSQVPAHFLAHYFAGALIATIGWWLGEGSDYSTERVSALFQEMMFRGIRNVLGLSW